MEEYVYDPLAGFHLVHDLYIELTKFGMNLNELYEYSVKELLFMLKYKREGLAFEIWRMASMNRLAYHAKSYPMRLKEAMPELFEHQKVKMPDWLLDDYHKKTEKEINRERR